MSSPPAAPHATQDGGVAPRPVARRPDAVRRRVRWCPTLPGAWGALVVSCVPLTPSLLPRTGLIQGVVSGISAALGYGLGVLVAATWRAFTDRGPRSPRPWAWPAFGVAALVLGALFLGLGRHWQGELRELMGVPGEPLWRALLAVPVALVVFGLLLGVSRGVRAATQGLAGVFSRWIGARAARALGVLLVAVLVVFLASGVALDGFLAASDRSFAVANAITPDGVAQPLSPLRSGAPGSLIEWDGMGREGRAFVAGGPSAADVSAFAGRPAPEPIRIYAGIDTAADMQTRAQRAVADLDRAGGFRRARLLVATATGQGWLDPGSTAAFEYVAGGDSAIVAMQYSYVPSGISYFVDQARARRAGRELFDAVYERWVNLPAAERPQLYVFGESLGSFGAEGAFSGEFDLRNRTDGALFVGPPNFQHPAHRVP
jgi:uncharacterized membrane protein